MLVRQLPFLAGKQLHVAVEGVCDAGNIAPGIDGHPFPGVNFGTDAAHLAAQGDEGDDQPSHQEGGGHHGSEEAAADQEQPAAACRGPGSGQELFVRIGGNGPLFSRFLLHGRCCPGARRILKPDGDGTGGN